MFYYQTQCISEAKLDSVLVFSQKCKFRYTTTNCMVFKVKFKFSVNFDRKDKETDPDILTGFRCVKKVRIYTGSKSTNTDHTGGTEGIYSISTVPGITVYFKLNIFFTKFSVVDSDPSISKLYLLPKPDLRYLFYGKHGPLA